MQTKKESLTEAITNTAIGFAVSYASTFLIFPLLGIATNAGTNLIIVIYFTIISILRGYVVRRWFNRKPTEPINYLRNEDKTYTMLHCFNCEFDMPVKIVDHNFYCSNCGLKH